MKGKPRTYRNQYPQDSDIEPFPVGSEIFAKIGEEPNGDALMASGQVVGIPTPINEFYQVQLTESQELVTCNQTNILVDPDTAIGTDNHFHLPSGMGPSDDDPFSPTNPEWMWIGGKIFLFVNNKIYKGKLDLDDDHNWIFTVRGRDGKIVLEQGLYDLPYSW
jgi:hypothetical protein